MTRPQDTMHMLPARRMGKRSKTEQMLTAHLSQMKPGEKVVVIGPQDTVVITRNYDQIEGQPGDPHGAKS